MSVQSFKENTNYTQRLKKSKYLLENYEGRVPVIIERTKKETILNKIDKNKYLIPVNMTISNILILIRQNITINENQSIYIMTKFNNSTIILNPTQSIETVYNTYRCDDGFLYLEYCGENIFG